MNEVPSFESCSHGAGRRVSRAAAKKQFSLGQHIDATAHVECRKDRHVIDETPLACKDIDAVMAARMTWLRSSIPFARSSA